jgi:hypothetical protein
MLRASASAALLVFQVVVAQMGLVGWESGASVFGYDGGHAVMRGLRDV